jgi:hypothetical protein
LAQESGRRLPTFLLTMAAAAFEGICRSGCGDGLVKASFAAKYLCRRRGRLLCAVEGIALQPQLLSRDDDAGAANHNDKTDQCNRQPEL